MKVIRITVLNEYDTPVFQESYPTMDEARMAIATDVSKWLEMGDKVQISEGWSDGLEWAED